MLNHHGTLGADHAAATGLSRFTRFLVTIDTEYGKQQHSELHRGKGCVVPSDPTKRARFPGSGHTDPDCINAEKCEVWEFKPNSATGRADGIAQEESYDRIVAKYYTEMYKSGQPPADALGGVEVMRTLKDKCLRDGEIKLTVDVHHYNMCEKKYECISD